MNYCCILFLRLTEMLTRVLEIIRRILDRITIFSHVSIAVLTSVQYRHAIANNTPIH